MPWEKPGDCDQARPKKLRIRGATCQQHGHTNHTKIWRSRIRAFAVGGGLIMTDERRPVIAGHLSCNRVRKNSLLVHRTFIAPDVFRVDMDGVRHAVRLAFGPVRLGFHYARFELALPEHQLRIEDGDRVIMINRSHISSPFGVRQRLAVESMTADRAAAECPDLRRRNLKRTYRKADSFGISPWPAKGQCPALGRYALTRPGDCNAARRALYGRRFRKIKA